MRIILFPLFVLAIALPTPAYAYYPEWPRTHIRNVANVDTLLSHDVSGDGRTDGEELTIVAHLTSPQPGSIGAGSGQTIRLAHLTSLRTAINEARAALGVSPVAFSNDATAGAVVRARHFQELRDTMQ